MSTGLPVYTVQYEYWSTCPIYPGQQVGWFTTLVIFSTVISVFQVVFSISHLIKKSLAFFVTSNNTSDNNDKKVFPAAFSI